MGVPLAAIRLVPEYRVILPAMVIEFEIAAAVLLNVPPVIVITHVPVVAVETVIPPATLNAPLEAVLTTMPVVPESVKRPVTPRVVPVITYVWEVPLSWSPPGKVLLLAVIVKDVVHIKSLVPENVTAAVGKAEDAVIVSVPFIVKVLAAA